MIFINQKREDNHFVKELISKNDKIKVWKWIPFIRKVYDIILIYELLYCASVCCRVAAYKEAISWK